MADMISSVLGLVFATGGIVLLYLSWQRSKRSWALVVGGWTFVVFSIFAWAQTSGIDKGPAKGIVAFILLALAALSVRAFQSPTKKRRTINRGAKPVPVQRADKTLWMRRVYDVILLTLLSGLAALAFSTMTFMAGKAMGAEHTANLTISFFMLPILWAIFAVMAGYVRQILYKSAALIGLIIIPSLVIPTLQ